MYLRNGILASAKVGSDSDNGKMWFKRAISAWKYASEKSSLNAFSVLTWDQGISLTWTGAGRGRCSGAMTLSSLVLRCCECLAIRSSERAACAL